MIVQDKVTELESKDAGVKARILNTWGIRQNKRYTSVIISLGSMHSIEYSMDVERAQAVVDVLIRAIEEAREIDAMYADKPAVIDAL